jgi:hypothetical protein
MLVGLTFASVIILSVSGNCITIFKIAIYQQLLRLCFFFGAPIEKKGQYNNNPIQN